MTYKNKETALKHITQKKFYKEDFDNFRDDKEVVLAAVSNYGGSLAYASDRLKDDKEVVLRAIDKSDGYVLEYASDRLKDDKELALEAVKKSGGAMVVASDKLKDDVEVVLEAVKQYKRAFQVASDRIKALCEGKDPVQVLESLILAEKLGNELNVGAGVVKEKKLKV